VSNGALIAAAIHLGFRYRAEGPNAYFNMGARGEHPVAHPQELGRFVQPARETKLATQRQIAWRNVMIAGINAGLAQEQFGLAPDDNRWAGQRTTYTFSLADMPALASVADGGFGELVFHISVNPTPEAHRWMSSFNAGFDAGDAFATGWLERRKGTWLMTTDKPTAAFRKYILPILASTRVEPMGYLPEGRFIM